MKKVKIPKKVKSRADELVKKAMQVASSELANDKAAKARVANGIKKRLEPYILEAETIAYQLQTPEYRDFARETKEFLGVLVGFCACPDGRITGLSLGDPTVASIYRKLRGMPSVRISTQLSGKPIPKDRFLRSAIWSKMKKGSEELVEFVGPHLYSSNPHHGCGAAIGAATGYGSGLPTTPLALHFGGIEEFFADCQRYGTYSAFDNFAKIAGGKGATFDITHDITTQGLIFGLRKAYKEFKPNKSLRENLIVLAKQKKIVMTEFLVGKYKSEIFSIAKKLDSGFSQSKPLNYLDFSHFSYNAMLIGRVAQKLMQREEKKGFAFIPIGLKKHVGKKSLRVLAYHLLRNVVYQVLGGIKKDTHVFIHHPEHVLRVGPIGADYNLKTVAFINNAPDVFNENNKKSTFALYQLMGKVLLEMGADLEKEARIITVTGTFDMTIYKDENGLQRQFESVATQVIDNAALIKGALQEAVDRGYAVVLPIIHHRRHRAIVDII